MLIECRECKNKISEEAQTCPHCGVPIKFEDDQVLDYIEKRARFGIKLSITAAILGLLLLPLALVTKSEIILALCALLGVPGIMGVFIHSLRLSHIKQSRNRQ
jgi:hypothetical protein